MTSQLSQQEYQSFCSKLETISGIVLGDKKEYLVTSRLRALLEEQELNGITALMGLMDRSSEIKQRVVNAMTTNETLWFRDDHPFKIFQNNILPELLKTKRKIRIWSAACSTGQEPYSLAMLLSEHKRLQPASFNAQVEIIATDLSTNALNNAQQGIYPMLALKRGMPDDLLKRYFHKCDDEKWQINDDMKRMIKFQQLNLQSSFSSLGKFDIVFCRNVLIYFSSEFKGDILTRIHGSLGDDGILFVGASESINQVSNLYKMEHCSPGIMYQKKPLLV